MIAAQGWAQDTVVHLVAYIAQREAGLRGFSPHKLWCMPQIFEACSVGGNADERILNAVEGIAVVVAPAQTATREDWRGEVGGDANAGLKMLNVEATPARISWSVD